MNGMMNGVNVCRKKARSRMLFKDLIKADIDIDVYDDYDERCGMAVCGPVKLTEEGKATFSRVMDMDVEIYDFKGAYGYHAVVHCETAEEAEMLKHFLLAAAGYIGDDLYKRWFAEV